MSLLDQTIRTSMSLYATNELVQNCITKVIKSVDESNSSRTGEFQGKLLRQSVVSAGFVPHVNNHVHWIQPTSQDEEESQSNWLILTVTDLGNERSVQIVGYEPGAKPLFDALTVDLNRIFAQS